MSCNSCGIQTVGTSTYANNVSMLTQPQLANQAAARMVIENPVVVIDQGLFMKKDTLTLLRFAYYSDPAEFVRVFNEVGIAINDPITDLPILAKLSESGGDKLGNVTLTNGQKIFFSVMDTYGKINPSINSLNQSNIKIIRQI